MTVEIDFRKHIKKDEKKKKMKENRIPDKPWRTITWGGKADDSGEQLKKTDKKRHTKKGNPRKSRKKRQKNKENTRKSNS